MKHERLSPVEFYEQEVLPALFERLDSAFPEFGWTRKGRGWTATKRVPGVGKTDGARPGRVVCNEPFGFLVHGGDATSWTAYVSEGVSPQGRDFMEAVRKLADLAGVNASVLDRDPTPEEEARHRRLELLETFVSQARDVLLSEAGKGARDYLGERGFKEDDLEDLPFGLYDTSDEVKRRLVDAGFTEDEVKRSGLLVDARWTGRLVIPWRNRWSSVSTIAARDVTGAAEEASKYLYLKGGKKPPAFGLDEVLRTQEGRDRLVLVEGLFDTLLLRSRGFPNVAALGGDGKLLTAERWTDLREAGVKKVVLVLDNDEPGKEGTFKAVDNVRNVLNVPVVAVVDPGELGDAKDPDEFVRTHGVDTFRAVVSKAVPSPVYRARALLESVTPASPDLDRRDAVERVLEYVTSLRGACSELDKEDALRLLAERTGYSWEALAELAREHEIRHAKEEAERTLKNALRSAQERLGKEDLGAVVHDVVAACSVVQGRTEDEPSPFSVDRLVELSRRMPKGRPSGWSSVDSLDVRFNPGELALLAARTGHAKTTVLVNLFKNWVFMPGDELLVLYSMEESEERIFHRLAALVSVDLAGSSASGRWTANEVRDWLRDPSSRESWPGRNLDEVMERLRSWEDRLLIVHRPGWNVEELADHARRVRGAHAVGAVFVDFLQRIAPPPGRYDRRDIEVSLTARTLKALAEDVAAPVLAGAQVNRESIRDAGKIPAGNYSEERVQTAIWKRRPALHHLREGGSEQEADLVLGLLNRRADFETDEEGERKEGVHVPAVTRLDLGVLKSRYGETGRWTRLAFEGQLGLVREWEHGELS